MTVPLAVKSSAVFVAPAVVVSQGKS